MKLWYISQEVNNDYDSYDSAVVAAETEELARTIHPGGYTREQVLKDYQFNSWADPKYVEVERIGTAKKGTKEGVVCSSFNAG